MEFALYIYTYVRINNELEYNPHSMMSASLSMNENTRVVLGRYSFTFTSIINLMMNKLNIMLQEIGIKRAKV